MTSTGRCTARALFLVVGLVTTAHADAPPAADPLPAGRFRGRVTGPEGQPVRGARIYVVPDAGDRPAIDRHRVETDADGRFEFDAPDMTGIRVDGVPVPLSGTLFATADGYAPDWFKIRTTTRSKDPVDIDLQLPSDTPLRGQFLDPEGQPLAGARVRVTQILIPRDRDLNAHLIRESLATVVNCSPGYERMLTRPADIPGVKIETRTDAQGRFQLTGLGSDRLVSLDVSAPTVVDTTLTVMTRAAPEVGTRVDFNGQTTQVIHGSGFTVSLKPGLTIRGLVRDRATQAPLSGMWVGPLSGDSPLEGLSTGAYHRTTDAQGRFTITGLDPRRLEWKESHQKVMAIAAPGMPYGTAVAEFDSDGNVVIDCLRAIPFRLKLVDEEGRPVPGEVTYRLVQPNPYRLEHVHQHDSRWPVSRAARALDGTYQGYVLPGPGAILVATDPRFQYRLAHVDPKGFFAPGRTEWTAQESSSAYGTHDTLSEGHSWLNQHDYSAIVLVNPVPDSKPLELSATVARDRPRQVLLVDPEGQPVTGVQPSGLTFHPWDQEPVLATATFSLRGLHPSRGQRITFFHEEKKWIGFLMARGDGVTPYTVTLQPWGTITGRIVDAKGQPLPANTKVLLDFGDRTLVTNPDPRVGELSSRNTTKGGTFQLDKLVPGQRYTARIYRKPGEYAGTAFKDLVLKPGETRALGDIRMQDAIDLLTSLNRNP